MATDDGTADALYALERIRYLDSAELSERDIFVATRSRFRTKSALRPILNRLIDHGYLVPLPPPAPTGGRPASPRFRIVDSAEDT